MTRVTNWAGNITFQAEQVHYPTSVAQLQEMVAGSERVRTLGTGHSFNRIADTDGTLVSVRQLPTMLEVDAERASVTVGGGVRYGELAATVDAAGFALANLGSLPHISVAGACATGTHGSGDNNRVLASSVNAMKLVTGTGEVSELSRSDPDFRGAVIGLGSLGVVVELSLDLVPSFQLSQRVYENLPLETLCQRFDEITSAAYSVSMFTRWDSDQLAQVWLKSKAPLPDGDFFGAGPADGPRHPLPDGEAGFATEQLGVPGPWYQRLPHFRLEFTPSSGAEIQSEYFVAREHAAQAMLELRSLGELLAPVLQVAEVRTVAADDLWISPCYGQDRVALHFTWISDHALVEPVLAEVERRLVPLAAVPHWGKLFLTDPQRLAELHPRLTDFADLTKQFDPAGRFTNDFTRRFIRS